MLKRLRSGLLSRDTLSVSVHPYLPVSEIEVVLTCTERTPRGKELTARRAGERNREFQIAGVKSFVKCMPEGVIVEVLKLHRLVEEYCQIQALKRLVDPVQRSPAAQQVKTVSVLGERLHCVWSQSTRLLTTLQFLSCSTLGHVAADTDTKEDHLVTCLRQLP